MAENIEEIITVYKAVTDSYIKDINDLIAKVKTLDTTEKKQADDNVKNANEVATASKTRKQLLDAEVANLAKLKTASKSAFTVPEIKKYSQDIAESEKNISLLKGETDSLGKVTSTLKDSFAGLGAGIIAAFSIQAVEAFGEASLKAFREAEVIANSLRFSVTQIGGEGEAAFKKLIDQSEKLQSISVFSDDEIQKSQDQLATFGLLSDEIEKLIPKIVDLASKKNISLAESTDLVIQGINGQTRALKPLGLEFKNTGDKAENLAIITEKLNKFQGATAEALNTSAGAARAAANDFNNLQESIGQKISQQLPFFQKAFSEILKTFDIIITDTDELIKKVNEGAAKDAEQGIEIEIASLIKLGKTRTEALITISRAGRDELQSVNDEIDRISRKLPTKEESNDLPILEARRKAILANAEAIANLIDKQTEAAKGSNLGLTDEAKLKQEADALAQRNKALEEEKKIQEQINKLRVVVSPTDAEKIEIQLEIDQQAAKKAVDDKRTFDQILIDTETKRSALFVLINKDAFDKINKLQSEREFTQDESNLKTFLSEQDKLINESATNETERDKQITALKEFELNQRIQNLKDYGRDASKAEQDLTDFQLAQIKKVADERIKVNSQIGVEQQRQKTAGVDLNSQAGIETEKQAAIDLANTQIDEQLSVLFNVQSTEQEKQLAIEKTYLTALKLSNDLADFEEKSNKLRAAKFIETFSEIASATSQLFSSIGEIENNQTQSRIDNLQTQLDAVNSELDNEQEAVDKNKNAKLISEKDYENQSATIKTKRVTAEKTINTQINAEKRKQAEIDRAISIFEIGINTAQAIIKTGAELGFPFAIPFQALAAALGVAQIAAVLSQPLPKFAKGVIDFKGKGNETSDENIVRISNRESIITAKSTLKYKEVLQAIQNDTFNQKFVSMQMVAPALISHRNNYETKKQENFAHNIANSIVNNNTILKAGLSFGDHAHLNQKVGVRISNAKEIATLISNSQITPDPYRD